MKRVFVGSGVSCLAVAIAACHRAPAEPRGPAPPRTAHVRLLAFNDFHGNLEPPTGGVPGVEGPVGAAAYFAAHVARLKREAPRSLLVAAGDLVGASPLASALFHDEPTIEFLNTVGLDATSLGNHELDEGIDELARLGRGGCHPKDGCRFSTAYAGAKFPILGANVRDENTGAARLPPWTILQAGKVPIGFIGLTLENTPGSVTPEGVRGLTFRGEVETVAAIVPELRRRGVEAIVVLVHQGGHTRKESLDGCDELHGPIVSIVEQLDPAVDVVVSGHTHALYNCVVAGRRVTSALSFGRVVTAIDLTLDEATRDVVRVDAKNHAVTHDVPPDPAVTALVARAVASAAPLAGRVVGRIARTLAAATDDRGESPLGEIIADAHLAATTASGAEVALTNASGVRSDLAFERSRGEAQDGVVTYGEAFAAQPFGNVLVTLTLTGEELRALLEAELRRGPPMQVSDGLLVRVSTATKSVVGLSLFGKPLAGDARVRVTVNSFLAERNPILRAGRERVTGPADVDALEAYFRSRDRVDAPRAPRHARAD